MTSSNDVVCHGGGGSGGNKGQQSRIPVKPRHKTPSGINDTILQLQGRKMNNIINLLNARTAFELFESQF